MKELTRIANACGTDKGTDGNSDSMGANCYYGYTEFYDSYFQKFKELDRKIYILEIGVFHGHSLQMYNDFFGSENCEIYGLDIDDKSEYNTENIHTFIVDQTNINQLNDFKEKMHNEGITFDIILDDGCHMSEAQLITLMTFQNLIKPNGIYIIEDLYTNWIEFYNNPVGFYIFSTLTFLMTLRYRYPLNIDDYYKFLGKEDDIIIWNRKCGWVNESAHPSLKEGITGLITFKNNF